MWAFDRLPAHVPRTYPDLGHAAAGAAGRRAVLCCSFLELFGGSCILLMVAWRMAELLLPPGGGAKGRAQAVRADAAAAWQVVPFVLPPPGGARGSLSGTVQGRIAQEGRRPLPLLQCAAKPASPLPELHLRALWRFAGASSTAPLRLPCTPPLHTAPAGLGPFSSTQLAAAVCSCALLPVLFIDIRQGLARLSAVGLASSGLVVLLVGALLLLDPRRGAMEQARRKVAGAGRGGACT